MSGGRFDDRWWGVLIKSWPIVLAFAGIVAMAANLKKDVEGHELRIVRLETGMTKIEDNTNRLVWELLEKKNR